MHVTRNIKYDIEKRNSMSSANQLIPVLVAGALGRMGSEVIKAIISSKDYQLVGAIDNQKDKEGQDIGSLLGLGPLRYSFQVISKALCVLQVRTSLKMVQIMVLF